jgi:chromosome partitioning protein
MTRNATEWIATIRGTLGWWRMHVLAFASRKGGSGKSTLAAHLALHAHRAEQRCLLIDEDPQASLTLWNGLRREEALPIKTIKRELDDVLKKAKRRGVDWVFIDTPANVSPSVVEAIRAARLAIIPCRPGLLDIDAVQETIDFCRRLDTPYAVVLNGAPPRRAGVESPVVTAARECLAELKVPVWGGQVTHRVSFSLAVSRGEGVQEQDLDQGSCAEVARLWQAIEKSVHVIKSARERPAMHRVAA